MAVIFAVGGAVIGGAVVLGHSDYSDYIAHNDYSAYSDAAEQRQRRINAKETEIKEQVADVNTYKTQSVNDYLRSASLKSEDGVTVSVSAVKSDGDQKIEDEVKINTDRESAGLVSEIGEIDSVLNKIDKILEEED